MKRAPVSLLRVSGVRRWVAAVLLAAGALGYPAAWQTDPWIFGVGVLGLAPLQLAVAMIGIVARLARIEPLSGLGWLVDALLIVSAAGALLVTRTISWA